MGSDGGYDDPSMRGGRTLLRRDLAETTRGG